MTIGERIAHLRIKNKMSQTALSKKADVPLSTISMLEGGIRKGEGLSVETARKIARGLGVTMDYLCGVYDDESEHVPTMAGVA